MPPNRVPGVDVRMSLTFQSNQPLSCSTCRARFASLSFKLLNLLAEVDKDLEMLSDGVLNWQVAITIL